MCQSWLWIYQHGLAAGDMVMAHGGVYHNTWGVPYGVPAPGKPVILMAYPGELPFIDNRLASGGSQSLGIGVDFNSWIVVDGFKVAGGLGSNGCIGGGGPGNTHIIIRHTDTTECNPGGIVAFDGLYDWTVEYNVAHDTQGQEHSIYMGSRNNPSSNIAIRRNIMFNPSEDRPAFQINGRINNLLLEQNIIYGTASGAGIALYNGVSYSRILNNLLFNNNGGLHFSNYDYDDCYTSSPTGICSHPQTGNLIANNVFWVGNMSGNVAATAPALQVDDASTGCSMPLTGGCVPSHQGGLGGNVYLNNVIINNNSGYRPVFFPLSMIGVGASGTCQLDPADTTLATTVFKNNILYGPGSNVVSVCPTGSAGAPVGKSITELNSGLWSASSAGNLNVDPQFMSASPSYFTTPGSFNFTPLGTSPLIGAGLRTSAPISDIWGATRQSPPSIGAVESASTTSNKTASPCDINVDGVVDLIDVQLVVNQVFSTSACALHAGACTVVDVQRVINASLSGACVTGQ